MWLALLGFLDLLGSSSARRWCGAAAAFSIFTVPDPCVQVVSEQEEAGSRVLGSGRRGRQLLLSQGLSQTLGPPCEDRIPECLLTRTVCVSVPLHTLAVPVLVHGGAEPPSPPPDPWRGWVSHGAAGRRGQLVIHFCFPAKSHRLEWQSWQEANRSAAVKSCLSLQAGQRGGWGGLGWAAALG